MPKGTAFCNSLVNLTYRAEAIANLADNAAASPITQIKARMATASYAASDNGSANEATYTNYVAQDVPRSGAPAGAERNPRCCAAESFNRIVEKEPSC